MKVIKKNNINTIPVVFGNEKTLNLIFIIQSINIFIMTLLLDYKYWLFLFLYLSLMIFLKIYYIYKIILFQNKV
jgi:4-hydroxybenzoate polyprenyltransferase